jgi:hypothetical protein
MRKGKSVGLGTGLEPVRAVVPVVGHQSGAQERRRKGVGQREPVDDEAGDPGSRNGRAGGAVMKALAAYPHASQRGVIVNPGARSVCGWFR